MIEIKKMDISHVPDVARLEAQFFSLPWSEKSIASELNNGLSLWLVALDGDRLAGYVGSQSVMGEADMMNLAVDMDYRRQGIGEKLVKSLITCLSVAGNHSLTLEVRRSNAGARALYEKLGFAEIGCRPRYYQKPAEDAIILRKEWTT